MMCTPVTLFTLSLGSPDAARVWTTNHDDTDESDEDTLLLSTAPARPVAAPLAAETRGSLLDTWRKSENDALLAEEDEELEYEDVDSMFDTASVFHAP
jgi:hypothetical protein